MSMSLGDGGEYTSANCPSDIIDTGLESAFNSGVFIVSASGNNHYTSGISYPACNEYVTSVGAVTKSDSITYNRGGDLLTLLAPGLSITSTWKGGGTATLSGTSMSAPHVAGAAAVLQQFARANAGALTQAQIRNALNSTGKPIYDSSSGGTYSRVSLFEAVKSLTDVSGPSLTMLLPLNMSYSTNSSIPLSYAANDINGINAAWYEIDGGGTVFILGDTTFDTAEGSHVLTLHANDSFGNEESVSTSFNVDMTSPTVVLSNPNNSYYISPVAFSFSLLEINPDSCSLYGSWDGWHLNQTKLAPENSFTASLEDGSYEWNIGCNDTANNLGFGSENFTANIDSTAPEVVISSPENKTYDNYTGIALDFSASDLNLDSCWYSLDDNNLSLAGCANTSFDTVDGHHNILVFANDSAGNEGFAELVFTVDTVIPSLVLSSPSEGETLSSDVNFTYSVEDVQVSNCSLLINGTVNLTEEDVQVFTLQQFSASLTDDWYYWSVSCADPFNNVNFSEERNFRVCTESWTCNAWSTCSNSQQARTCTDANSCGTTNNKPVESQSCSDPQPPSSSGSSGGGGGGGSKKIASSVPPQVIKKEETPKPAEEKPVTEQQPEPKKGEPEVVKEQVQTTSLESATGSTTAPSEPSAMGISTRAVNSIKSNKIAVGGFVFVIAVMVSLHFIFFKKYLASKKKNSNKSWLEKINFFKSYRELLNPKKP
ncbi:hypothetical protein FJZ53_04195, partial [Candidatus Woesearchaeota archaeon]|nr:hypothetical protein [Candidatus Woesearchaeota archaeon]